MTGKPSSAIDTDETGLASEVDLFAANPALFPNSATGVRGT